MTKKLHLVPSETPASPLTPPRPLGKHGAALWASILAEYQLDDAGGVEMLAQACAALDTAELCSATVAKDGAVIRQKGRPPREHPLLKIELANRAFVTRTLSRLGLDVEPVRAGPGRPPMFA